MSEYFSADFWRKEYGGESGWRICRLC